MSLWPCLIGKALSGHSAVFSSSGVTSPARLLVTVPHQNGFFLHCVHHQLVSQWSFPLTVLLGPENRKIFLQDSVSEALRELTCSRPVWTDCRVFARQSRMDVDSEQHGPRALLLRTSLRCLGSLFLVRFSRTKGRDTLLPVVRQIDSSCSESLTESPGLDFL